MEIIIYTLTHNTYMHVYMYTHIYIHMYAGVHVQILLKLNPITTYCAPLSVSLCSNVEYVDIHGNSAAMTDS